jgi:hypothetical protein
LKFPDLNQPHAEDQTRALGPIISIASLQQVKSRMAQSSMEINRSFRKVRGHQQIKSRINALRRNDNTMKKAA